MAIVVPHNVDSGWLLNEMREAAFATAQTGTGKVQERHEPSC